jgi:hypothetical protein
VKKIFLLVTLVAGFVSAFAQNDDSTKYIWYKFQYGFRQPRVQADSIMTVPRDTAHNAKYGSLAVKKDTLYFKDSTKWVQASTDLSKLPFISIDKRSLYDSIGKVYFTGPTPTEVKLKAQLQDEGGIGTRDRNVGGALTTDTTTAHTIDAYTVGANSVANVRTIALPSNLFHIRLSDQQRKFVQDYQYDASDVSTADDGIFTLVGPGSQRYKAVIRDYIDAKLFGLDATLGNNTTVLQAAVTAASSYPGTHTLLIANGNFIITGTVTIPSNVTLKFAEGGMISGAGTINGGIIEAPMRAQIFGITTTVHPDAVASMWSMKWFGAVGSGAVDDRAALQRCWDMCAYANKIKHIWWPSGIYLINKGLLFERDDNADGVREFPTGYTIEGESKSFGGSGEVVINLHNDSSFAIGFQLCKGFLIKNLYVDGGNTVIAGLTYSQVFEGAGSLWNSTQRTQINSPSACFLVDPVGIPSMGAGTKYPDFTAKYSDPTTGGSTDITYENCAAFNSIVGFGISVNGTTQNGDMVNYNSCWDYQVKYAFVQGSSQNRSTKINKCGVWGRVFTLFDCSTFGDNIGDPPQIEELNTAGLNKYLCNLNTFANSGLTINNSHFESLWSLGGCFTGESAKLTITNSWVAMAGTFLPGDGTTIHPPKTMFRGRTLNMTNCFFSYYQSGTTPVSIDALDANFTECGLDNIVINNLSTIGTTNFDKCYAGGGIFEFGDNNIIQKIDPSQISGNLVMFTTNMKYIPEFSAGDFYVSLTRTKVNRTLGQFGYGGKDFQQIDLGTYTPSNIVATNAPQASSTADITLAHPSTALSILQVGDYLLTQTTDEYGRTNVLTAMGQIYAINTSTGVVSLKTTMIGLSAIAYRVWLYRQPYIIPAFAVGRSTSGSNIIDQVEQETGAVSFPTGVTLNSNNFPEGTYIVSYNSGTKQLTVSNNATTSDNLMDIIDADYQMVQYGYPNTSLAARLGYKQGDIIWNKRPDLNADVLFFVCTQSGVTNSTKLPTFRAFYKNMAPPLVDNTAADVWGLTFYYNTTSHEHRIKQNGTWRAIATLDGTETLTNKTLTTPTIASFTNATHNHQNAAGGGTLAEAALALTDITTNNVTTSAHGFMPKLTNVAGNYFDATGSYNNTYIWRHTTVNNAITSITGGTGEGTSGSRALAGGDVGGKITITTGTGPTASATVETIVFSAAYASAPYVLLTPANAAAAALTGNGQVYISSTSTTQFVITAGSTNLVASTQYIWYYQVVQ